MVPVLLFGIADIRSMLYLPILVFLWTADTAGSVFNFKLHRKKKIITYVCISTDALIKGQQHEIFSIKIVSFFLSLAYQNDYFVISPSIPILWICDQFKYIRRQHEVRTWLSQRCIESCAPFFFNISANFRFLKGQHHKTSTLKLFFSH